MTIRPVWRKIALVQLLCLALLSVHALAQGPQNVDMSIMVGPARVKPHVVASSVSMSAATGRGYMQCFGRQLKRTSAGSLWLEVAPFTIISPGTSKASIGGSIRYRTLAFTTGVRFMVPLHPRFSVYGVLGGGAGLLRYAELVDGPSPLLRSNTTWRGLGDFGGGVDLRLTSHLSLRGEIRDFVTSPGLSGASGRHHPLPLFGIAFHH